MCRRLAFIKYRSCCHFEYEIEAAVDDDPRGSCHDVKYLGCLRNAPESYAAFIHP